MIRKILIMILVIITLNQPKQQRDFDEDKLIQKTTIAYNDIVTSQMKIDKATKTLRN